MTKWIRSRFRVCNEEDDYRPVKWPPVGPYWCTGSDLENPTSYTIVAYTKTLEQVTEFWPDAEDI